MTAVFQNCDTNNIEREMNRMQNKQKVLNRYFEKEKNVTYFEIRTSLAQH